MIFNCKTKDEAKAEAKAWQDIESNQFLGMAPGVFGLIASFQSNPANRKLNEMSPDNLIIPAAVVQFISQGVWKYDFTTSPENPPSWWTGAPTTWVKVTKISWA